MVYAKVLTIKDPHKAAHGQEKSHIPALPQGAANPASRSDAGLGGCERVTPVLACATRSMHRRRRAQHDSEGGGKQHDAADRVLNLHTGGGKDGMPDTGRVHTDGTPEGTTVERTDGDRTVPTRRESMAWKVARD